MEFTAEIIRCPLLQLMQTYEPKISVNITVTIHNHPRFYVVAYCAQDVRPI